MLEKYTIYKDGKRIKSDISRGVVAIFLERERSKNPWDAKYLYNGDIILFVNDIEYRAVKESKE